MVGRLKESPHYRGHHVCYGFPFTLGTIAFFSDREALFAFARSPEHAELMPWVMAPGKARGGFIRFYEVKPHGYSSGVWRAEAPHDMKAIDHFTALGDEVQGPLVRDALRR